MYGRFLLRIFLFPCLGSVSLKTSSKNQLRNRMSARDSSLMRFKITDLAISTGTSDESRDWLSPPPQKKTSDIAFPKGLMSFALRVWWWQRGDCVLLGWQAGWVVVCMPCLRVWLRRYQEVYSSWMMSLLSFMVGQPLIRVIADAAGGGIPMLRSHGMFWDVLGWSPWYGFRGIFVKVFDLQIVSIIPPDVR